MTAQHRKLKKTFSGFVDFLYFQIESSGAEIFAVPPRMRFLASILRVMKKCKKREKTGFLYFFIIERVFVKGIQRKNKKKKTVFASILIRNYTFFKNINSNYLKLRVQCVMKISYIFKIKNVYNAKML